MKVLIAMTVLILASLRCGQAEGKIYTWTDASGVTHFSTTQATENAKPAKLPPLQKEKFDLADIKLKTCDAHGGIDCSKGADTDGSVICLDAFDGAAARYQFHCLAAQLTVNEVNFDPKAQVLSVYVRNTKGVLAEKPLVFYTTPQRERVTLQGPTEIAAHGGELFELKGAALKGITKAPSSGEFEVRCDNCG
jgi:hypothetical protein